MTPVVHVEPITGASLVQVSNRITTYLKTVQEEDVLGVVFNQDSQFGWSALVFIAIVYRSK